MAEPDSLRHVYAEAVRRLRSARIATPELDARLLICAAAGLSVETYVADSERALSAADKIKVGAYLNRRLAGEPVARILGEREFYGHSFKIDASTLDPRPETETLVEVALALTGGAGARDRPLSLLDLGTGSGCLLVTLLAELPGATGVGIDISAGALKVARRNAEAHGVGRRAHFVQGDWLDPLVGRFDLIVANPPYIGSAEIKTLSREVREHDPLRALDGGADGLFAYRRIVEGLHRALRPGGLVLLEIRAGQKEQVTELLRDSGVGPEAEIACYTDLAGHSRCVAARRARRAVAGKNCLEKGLLRASFEPAE